MANLYNMGQPRPDLTAGQQTPRFFAPMTDDNELYDDGFMPEEDTFKQLVQEKTVAPPVDEDAEELPEREAAPKNEDSTPASTPKKRGRKPKENKEGQVAEASIKPVSSEKRAVGRPLKNTEKTKQTTITLPLSLWKQVRNVTTEYGSSMTELVESSLSARLNNTYLCNCGCIFTLVTSSSKKPVCPDCHGTNSEQMYQL